MYRKLWTIARHMCNIILCIFIYIIIYLKQFDISGSIIFFYKQTPWGTRGGIVVYQMYTCI